MPPAYSSKTPAGAYPSAPGSPIRSRSRWQRRTGTPPSARRRPQQLVKPHGGQDQHQDTPLAQEALKARPALQGAALAFRRALEDSGHHQPGYVVRRLTLRSAPSYYGSEERGDHAASITYGGNTITSNTATTLLLLAPTIAKAVDKPTAGIGDTLTYTLTITNLALSALTNLPLTDTIPQGAAYQTDSFKVNGTAAAPTVTGNTLTYTIPTVPAAGTAVVTFQVLVKGGST